jgi:hypothetical protein
MKISYLARPSLAARGFMQDVNPGIFCFKAFSTACKGIDRLPERKITTLPDLAGSQTHCRHSGEEFAILYKK